MATTSLNILLPQALKEFVHERVAEKACRNPGDDIRALIRADQSGAPRRGWSGCCSKAWNPARRTGDG